MIKHIWTVLCSRAVFDKDTNNVSLQNVIERLNIQAEPIENGVIPIPLHLVSMWTRSDLSVGSKAKVKITLYSPSGHRMETKGDEVIVEVNTQKTENFRSRVLLNGFPSNESGRYWFYVDIQQEDSDEWDRAAEIPVTVVFTPPD